MSSDPIRAALERLVELQDDTRHTSAIAGDWDDAIAFARAALAAAPEGEPSDEELLDLMPETMRDEFSYASEVCSDATGGQVKPGIFRVCLNASALQFARAVHAHWGRPAAPPAPLEGEVGELVAVSEPTEAW